MAVTYFKRFKMELRLDRMPEESECAELLAQLPEEFEFIPWSQRTLNGHASVKWSSFRDEVDAHVFPCLRELRGCKDLMREISGRKDFAPDATWLVCRNTGFTGKLQPCGTVQGLLSSPREGAIQNIGVDPQCRDRGIGTALLVKSLIGFRQIGCRFVNLEVTIQNTAAIRLYERFGFRHVETLFKMAEVQYA